jgi:hypothetical protein
MNDRHLQDNALELCKAQLSFYQHFIDGDLKSLREMLKDMNERFDRFEKEILVKKYVKQ